MAAPRPVEADQPGRRHAAEIQDDQGEMQGGAANPAVAFPAASRGHGTELRSKQASALPRAPDEIDVLHDRQLVVAAQILEDVSLDEQRLIAVRKTEEPHTESHADLDEPRERRRG